MIPFGNCPVCDGEVIEKGVEKLLRGGVNIATVTVPAEVCLHCGDRLFSKGTVNRFEQIRDKLARQQMAEFDSLGRSFRVPA